MGVNAVGYESGNEDFTEGRDLPWLQDVEEEDVWGALDPTYRDVWVLNSANEVVDVFNLSSHDLVTADNYNTLREMFVEAAAP